MIDKEVIAIWDYGLYGEEELYEVQSLVRCKDCKKKKTWKCPFYRAGYTYDPLDYCSDGKIEIYEV